MTMALTFDTLAYANKLKTAGVDPKIAEAQAEIQAETFSELIQNRLATKDDLQKLRLATKDDLQRLEVKTDKIRTELLIKLGGMMVTCTAILGALITILSHL